VQVIIYLTTSLKYNKNMPKLKISLKNDKFKKARGSYSRLLDISCENCQEHICFYQKDGPGIIKRMYLDRIYESTQYSNLEKQSLNNIPKFICPKCHRELGNAYIYEKENRLAYRLFVGAILKKIVKKNKQSVMPIFFKKKIKEKSKLDKHGGQWIAVKGQDDIVAYGETVEEVISHVKVEGKTIKDKLPDPREVPTAMKLPENKKI